MIKSLDWCERSVTLEPEMERLIAGDLRIDVEETSPPEPLRLIWSGKSNDRQPTKMLAPYFSQALGFAAKRSSPIELHFEKLDHFNSSTITAIILLIQEARSKGVRLVLVFDQALKWQK